MYKKNLALNNPQCLIFHKKNPNQSVDKKILHFLIQQILLHPVDSP